MSKRNKIIYWVATIWLSLGMLSTGVVQLLSMREETEFIIKLGYPSYILPMLGVCKILAVVALLVPKFPLLKEWAYAGLFFMMAGALFSHAAAGDPAKEFFGPSLLVLLMMLSWYFRPVDRRVQLANA